MKTIRKLLKKIPGTIHAKQFLWKNFLRRDIELESRLEGWRIWQIDRPVRKALCLQDLLSRSPETGAIVECGVGSGWSLGLLSQLSTKKIYAFDSFQGFPEGSSKDSPTFTPKDAPIYKEMGIDFVKKNMARMGVRQDAFENQIFMIPGFFPASFSGFDHRVSFLHLDVDLYQSSLDCLKFFYPLLELGGHIAFDEYDDPRDLMKWPGAKIAIDEFVAQHNLKLERHWTGFVFLVKH